MKYLIGILCFLCTNALFSQFSFQGETITAGTKKHFKIPISDKNHNTFIPITVFCGIEKGPTLGITAGVHGYEYPPIIAGQRLIKSIDPKTLKGIVILVQIANVGSFSNRSPFVNALDKKNLNRTFPGDANGTVTEKIADFITKNVIAKSDFFLDVHAGDASEDLMPYSAYYSNKSMNSASSAGRKMAEALLFDHIVIFNTDGKDYVKKDKPSLYCSAEAFKRNIPSVDIECGRLGMVENAAVLNIEKGILNMLLHLNMRVSLEKSIQKNSYLFIEDRTYQSSSYDGIFYPVKKSGDYIAEGMTIGKVTDYFGKTLETIYAKADGIILLTIGTPPVNKGETLLVIGNVKKH
ncbi:M14 family metallopeptidase [uncultured Tenacibaculum sp.]|uniref:M14 family metallopeptidase n=1 Tax=uncultured Tenacibaculum sp. TaxID=174713 RepID=UPI00261B2EC1|nr:M14 family metallopeptidase [uncultured Tenacibaculum sp.]